MAAAAICYAAYVWRDQPGVRFPPIKLPVALFCLWTVVSMFFAENPAAGGFAIRKLVLFVILLLTINVVISTKHLELLFQGLFLEAALAGLVGTVQFVEQYRTVRALHPDRVYYYMTLERIHGFMGHWMNFSGQQMLVFAALLAFLLTVQRPRKLWWGVLAVIGGSILLSFTRGVWLGCLAASLYLVVRTRPRWLWAIPTLLLAGYLAAPSLVLQRLEVLRHPSTDPSLSIRFEMWEVAWRMMRTHPWVGVGPNNIEQVYARYLPPGKTPEYGYHGHVHNNFLQFGAERGLPCLAAWVWLMAALGWQTWGIRRRLSQEQRSPWVADAAFAAWLALLAEGFFEFNFGTSPVLMLYLFLSSTPFVLERIGREPDRQSGVKD